MSSFELFLIGVMLVILWSLAKIVVAIIDLLEKLISMAIVLAIVLMMLAMLVVHLR